MKSRKRDDSGMKEIENKRSLRQRRSEVDRSWQGIDGRTSVRDLVKTTRRFGWPAGGNF